jgi:hypothetical protein
MRMLWSRLRCRSRRIVRILGCWTPAPYCRGLPALRHDSALPSAEKRITADSSLQKARVPELGSEGAAVTLKRDAGVPLHPLRANTYPFFLPMARRGSINIA